MAKRKQAPREPLLEWLAAAVGLLLSLAVVAIIGREALNGEMEQPPAIEVRAERVVPLRSGFLVEVEAANRSGGTAAIVEVEGTLKSGEATVETSTLAFDYVPGHAERKGGLFFKADPRTHSLELRALGYQAP